MPKLIIDNIPVEVPQGTNVLEAARSVGILIPHFCYHPALPIAGACRLCAVKLLDGPVKGIQMSCTLAAQDGMVVSTADPEALKMRSMVIEWLMLNHPHDCPVCDEGGECLLQDFTIAGGHSRRRYQGKKRTYINQYLGEGISHEMNRCIQCYRCTRFYQDYAGGTDFGVTGSAARVYFGRFADGALESPFSGNLVDICPTGVFTDKTGRYRARYWDYQFAPSICPHCSVGCNISPQAYQREVIKIVARRNEEVNGWFICDRGRFNKAEVNDPLRPRQPLVDGEPAGWDGAVEALTVRIVDFIKQYGAQALALVGSTSLSLEAGLMLARLARTLEGAHLCFYADPTQAATSAAAVEHAENAASLADLREADCVVIIGCELLEEAPMMALAVRQAFLKGAPVFLVAPSPAAPEVSHLPFQVTVVPALREVPLQEVKRGVVVCGAGEKDPGLLETVAGSAFKLALLQPGPNGFGAALLHREYRGISLSEAIDEKMVRAIVAFEADLPHELLEKVTVLGAADWRNSKASRKGSVLLPTTAWVEGDGTWVNYEGRAQRFRRSMRTGLPLRGLAPIYHAARETPAPEHPPRVPRATPPGGEPRDCWRLLTQLMEKLGAEAPREPFTGKWEALEGIDPEGPGVRIRSLWNI